MPTRAADPRDRPRHLGDEGRPGRGRRHGHRLGRAGGAAAGAARRRRRAGPGRVVGRAAPRSSPTSAAPTPTTCGRSPRCAPPPRARARSPSTPRGEPLTPCISWLDMRGAANLRRQFGGFPSYGGLSVRRIVALAAPDRRDAVGDRQGPRRAHAAGARRDAGGLRAHRVVPQRARLDQPQADRAHGGDRRLDPDLVGHRQPAARPTSATPPRWSPTAASTATSCRRSSPAPT